MAEEDSASGLVTGTFFTLPLCAPGPDSVEEGAPGAPSPALKSLWCSMKDVCLADSPLCTHTSASNPAWALAFKPVMAE